MTDIPKTRLLVLWKLLQRLFYCFPVPWLAQVESSQKSNGMWFSRHFFAPYLFHRSRNNRRDKLRSKFWREKMFRKPHLKLLRWFSVHRINSPNMKVWQYGKTYLVTKTLQIKTLYAPLLWITEVKSRSPPLQSAENHRIFPSCFRMW